MKKIFTHIARWNEWRKRHDSSWLYKFQVLIGYASPPPTFRMTLTRAEKRRIKKSLDSLAGEIKALGDTMSNTVLTFKAFSDELIKGKS